MSADDSRPTLPQPRRQRLALQQLHRDVGGVAVDAVVEDLDDVRARSAAAARASRMKRASASGLLAICGSIKLDRDRRLQGQVVGQPHRPHAALAQLMDQFVLAGEYPVREHVGHSGPTVPGARSRGKRQACAR